METAGGGGLPPNPGPARVPKRIYPQRCYGTWPWGRLCVGCGARGPEEYPPLPPAVLDTVLALGDEELHRYGTRRKMGRRTGGRWRLAPGTLHRSPRQVQEKGLAEGSEELRRRPRRRAAPLLQADGVGQEGRRRGGRAPGGLGDGGAFEGPGSERAALRGCRGRLMAARGGGLATPPDTPVPANHVAGGSALAARLPAPAAVCSLDLIGLLRRRGRAIIRCQA
jgi:hypothetical protein